MIGLGPVMQRFRIKVQLSGALKEAWYIVLQDGEGYVSILPRADDSKVPFHMPLGASYGRWRIKSSVQIDIKY